MLNIHTDCKSTKTLSTMDSGELIRVLGEFPSPVLPTGVLHELQSRGDAIHDSLVALIREGIDSEGGGLGSMPNSRFFAFALLVPIATKDDLALIESLLTLPKKSIDALVGDLVGNALQHLIARLFQGQSAAELIGWINQLADHPNLRDLDAYPLFRGMTLAVTMGYLDRMEAIEALLNRLKKRADQREDLQSALAVCELMDLSASDVEAVDAAVRSCFKLGQIASDFVEIDSWDDVDSHGRVPVDRESWSDPAAELSTWCFEFVCDGLDPVDATFRVNQQASRGFRPNDYSVPDLIDQLRNSTDEHFPHDAVLSINRVFAEGYHATVDMIREEVARFQVDVDSWSGNGAYLGLVLSIANDMPLPTDLLQTILRLPQSDREQIFGDQFGLIVQAVALTPLRQHEFVEQWIWDTDRCDADRREMVEYYLKACYNGQLDRKVSLEALVSGLRRALVNEPILIAPHAECLAYFTPKEHQQVLEEAFDRDDVEFFLPIKEMRRMAQDAEFALDQLRENSLRFRSLRQIITDGVMFSGDVFQVKPPIVPSPVYQSPPQGLTPKPLRNETRTPRNAACPCGSGKKYKKCCMRSAS